MLSAPHKAKKLHPHKKLFIGVFVSAIFVWLLQSRLNHAMRNILPICCFFLSLTLCGQNQIKQFCVDPTMQLPLNDSENTMYCSSFIQAWIELCNMHDGAIILDSNSVLLEQLNAIKVNRSISEDFVVAKAGYIKDSVIAKINRELEQKFKISKSFSEGYNDNDIISYAYLKKQIKFYYLLQDDFGKEKMVFNGSDTVDFFGLRYAVTNPVNKSRILIHNYKSSDNFILEIKTKVNTDQVIIAKMQPESTLAASYSTIMQRVKLNDTSYIEEGEMLKIPYISFSIEENFRELKNRKLLNPGFTGYTIREAKQVIDFSLNGKGVSLESEGELRAIFAIVENSTRQFVFDKPFFIILKERDKNEPYFCMYIANATCMIK